MISTHSAPPKTEQQGTWGAQSRATESDLGELAEDTSVLTVSWRAGLLSVLPRDGLPVTVHGSTLGQLLEGEPLPRPLDLKGTAPAPLAASVSCPTVCNHAVDWPPYVPRLGTGDCV